MKFKVDKKGKTITFTNVKTKGKFNYIEFADKLYAGEQVEIVNMDSLADEERENINNTIKELNDLADPRKRKRIIEKLNRE